MNIKEFRQKYPEYNDMPDQALADSLYQKHYSDMDRSVFDQSFFGIKPSAPQESYQMPADPTSESLAMFSPTQAGKGAQMVAPEIGMTLGGAVGSKIPIPGATPFMTGLGYAGGEAIKEGAVPSLDQFTQNFGKGAAMDLAAKPLSWVAEKAFAPIKQAFSMLRAGQLAEKGLPIPASSINPSERGITLANKARSSYPGNEIVQEAHEKLRLGANNMLQEFKNEFGVYNYSKQATDKAFETWAEAMGGNDATVLLPSTNETITKILGDTKNRSFFANRQFPAKVGEVAPGVPDILDELAIDMNKISQAKNPGKDWVLSDKNANKFWNGYVKSFQEDPTVQGLRDIWATISGGKGPDKTARMKLLKSIEDDINSVYGEDIANLLKYARNESSWNKKVGVLKTIIKNSHETVNGTDTFMPDKFGRLWEAARNSGAAKKFASDELAKIDEFAGMMEAIGGELSQKVSDKGIGSLLQTAGGAGAMGAALQYGTGLPASVPVLALPLINAGISKYAGQIFKPGSGLYRQALGEPMAREMIPGLINVGGRLILLQGNKLLEGK